MASSVEEPLPKLDFTEALKDSPRFRHMIGVHETYFLKLDGRLNECLRVLTTISEYGKQYVSSFYALSVLVNQLCAETLPQDTATLSTLKSLSDAYAHIVHLNRVLIETATSNIYASLNNFSKGELAKIGETRSQFENLSTSLDEALCRKASVPRSRGAELSDARNALTAVGTCFAHTTLDYVAQINIIHAKKDHIILDALWSFVKECNSFFSRGHAFFDEWTAVEDGSIANTVTSLVTKSKSVERKMQDRHSLVPKEVFLHPTGMSPEDDVVMEGYLFKRATNAFKTWHRRWFQIKDNKLLYSHRSAELETPTVMEPDLKLCLVRPAPSNVERACCFELVTPTKSHLLQADSDTLCNAWMRALQRTIHHLHESDDSVIESTKTLLQTTLADCDWNNPDESEGTSANGSDNNMDTAKTTSDKHAKHQSHSSAQQNQHQQQQQQNISLPSTSTKEKGSFLSELRRIPGNDKCADCGADAPKWASINIGVLLCIECCGIHRSFGVQISKIRSLTMDSFELEQRKLMLSLGNRLVNSIYLAYLPTDESVMPPQAKPSSTRLVREAWIRAKYVERRFARLDRERAQNSANLRAERLLRKTNSAKSPLRSCSARELTTEHVEGKVPDNQAKPSSNEIAGSCAICVNDSKLGLKSSEKETTSICKHGKSLSPYLPEPLFTNNVEVLQRRVSVSCGSDTEIEESQQEVAGSSGTNDVTRQECGENVLKAAASGDIAELSRLVAHGVDIHATFHKTTALHTAIKNNQGVAAEFLLLNGSKVNSLDDSMNSPLHIASANAHTLIVCQLMKRGADQHLKNSNGETALDLAVEGKHADIVTLLRLQEMRNEFSEEFNNPMDETVDCVMMDISRRVDPTL